MKASVVTVVAAAAVASARNYNASSTTWTTEVVTAFTTFCPLATELVYGEKTYTVTDSTTLTITDCPCTISKPVVVVSSVWCETCGVPTTLSPHVNGTWSAVQTPGSSAYSVQTPTSLVYTSAVATTVAAATSNAAAVTTAATATTIAPIQPTAGADRSLALSGAALAGLVGLAAFVL